MCAEAELEGKAVTRLTSVDEIDAFVREFENGFVPRTQRSAHALRGVVRCRAGAVPKRGVRNGPGSAVHR
ncbi:MAG: hypothetical protein QOJ84_3705 [Bradyrhizobium sp.]|nr:hypothetical protein [Bradyrhizobium sp.]